DRHHRVETERERLRPRYHVPLIGPDATAHGRTKARLGRASRVLKGGVGYATFRPNAGSTTSGSGFGLIAGAGYDVRIGRNVSLTPVGNFLFGDDGHVTRTAV